MSPEPPERDPSVPNPEKTTARAADSSAGSSTSSPYVGGTGPGFDPRDTPPSAPAPEPPNTDPFAVAWQEEQVGDWLRNAGDLAHAAVGVGEYDWVMTERDLARIAPPATRILNRFEPSRAVAAYSDPAAVAIGFGLYGWRSALERIAVLRAQQGDVVDEQPSRPYAVPDNGNVSHTGPTTPDGYVTAADRLRATRPPGGPDGNVA